MRITVFLLTFLMLCSVYGKAINTKEKQTFSIGKGTFLINSEPIVVKAAEVHYPRIPEPYWEHRIQM